MMRYLTFTILTLALLTALIGCESTATTKPSADASDTETTLPDLPDEPVADDPTMSDVLTADDAARDVPIMPAQLDAPAPPSADDAPAPEALPIPETAPDESEDVAPVLDTQPAADADADDADIPVVSSTLANTPTIFVGDVTASQMGPTGMSNPPLYNTQLTLDITELLRGQFDSDTATVSYQVRQQNPPVFNIGDQYLVTGHYDTRVERFVVESVRPVTDDLLTAARFASTLPIGWSSLDGVITSPFEMMKWTEGVMDTDVPTDAVTGRPALLVPEGITLSAEKVPPVKDVKWSNSDGDGEYILTVTNTTDEPIAVPALLSDEDGNILWTMSLVVLVKDTSGVSAQPAPGAMMMKGDPQATTLQPGESVSTVVNALLLKDVEWPQGGYRVEFTFCLGQLGVMKSFYYKTNHHGPIREALTAPAEDTSTPTEQ